ncbi:MAG: Protein transport protein S9 plasma membrane t-SNARE [Phylliscum demangeonii]|nr:MAG: Protein transport protein S9 plasma membrane t-SNARE [Phylliscum demangeonii]
MPRFGFGKKSSEGGEEDANRTTLFGTRSSKNHSSSSTAPALTNPYAQPAAAVSDPYAQADGKKYATATTTAVHAGPSGYGGFPPRMPPPSSTGAADRRRDPYGTATRDTAYAGAGYGADGSNGGRGGGGGGGGAAASGPAASGAAPSRYGAGGGGYGGLGGTADSEADREALFGGAPARQQQRQQQQHHAHEPPPYSASSSAGPDSGTTAYGAYGEDRQLTAAEEEDEDVAATKQQMAQMKREDVASTRNALRMAAQAEDSGRATLERLAAQGERIHNTEKNLDLATNQNRVAEARAKELKTLNRSMFAVHVANPFTKAQRGRVRDEDIIGKHRAERDQRAATRAAGYEARSRMDDVRKELGGPPAASAASAGANAASGLAARARFQFEADSEDDEMEKEIDGNLTAMARATGRLNALARATGQEVDEQNRRIETIIEKSDRVDDQIAMNRTRLERIH